MYDFTVRLATFASPRLAQRYLLPSLAGRPAETERLLRGFVTTPAPPTAFAWPAIPRAQAP